MTAVATTRRASEGQFEAALPISASRRSAPFDRSRPTSAQAEECVGLFPVGRKHDGRARAAAPPRDSGRTLSASSSAGAVVKRPRRSNGSARLAPPAPQIRSSFAQACREATMVVLGLPIAAARRGGRDGDDHGFRLRTWPELTEFGRVDGGPWRIVALVTPWTVIWWRRGPIHKSPVGGALFCPILFFH
jgi:hypothetical protein